MKREVILENIKILYVEDDKNVRETVSDSLKLFNIDFNTAVDGVDGIKKFKKGNFDLIISDIKMPNLNGLDMMKNIRKLDEKIPLIFTTAFNDSEYLLDAIPLRVNSYLIKPIVIDELIAEIVIIMEPIFQNKRLKKQKEIIDAQSKELLANRLLLTISHQWRQPLSLICAISTKFRLQLELGTLDLDALNQGFEMIENESSTMSEILLKHEKLFKTISTDKILLKELIEEMVLFLKKSFPQCSIECMIDVDDDILLDSERYELVQILLIVFQSIMENYLKLALENGIVNITTRYDDEYLILEIKPDIDENIKIEKIPLDMIETSIKRIFNGKIIMDGGTISFYISKSKIINYKND